MNTDFRVSVDFFTHHKSKKLSKRLGAPALVSLLKLWAYAAKFKTDGDLSGMSAEDVELAADWGGEDGAFVAALIAVGFIDQVEKGFVLHDWEDHNSWASRADDRSDTARFSRLAQVNPKAFDELKAKGVNAISKEEYEILADAKPRSFDATLAVAGDSPANRQRTASEPPATASDPLAPSPSPSFKKEEINTTPPSPPAGGCPAGEPLPVFPARKARDGLVYSASFLDFWEAFPLKVGKEAAFRAWKKAKKKHPAITPGQLTAAIRAQVECGHFRGHDGQDYIPHPATWLNQGRWEDETEASGFPAKNFDDYLREKGILP